MASILKVDELRGIASAGSITVTSEGGAATQSLQQGLAKVWVNFNGTGTVAIRDSFNVSSLTDVTTASYSVNYASAMNTANYSVGGTLKYTGSGTGLSLTLTGSTPLTTTQADVFANADNSVGAADNDTMLVNVHGDLA